MKVWADTCGDQYATADLGTFWTTVLNNVSVQTAISGASGNCIGLTANGNDNLIKVLPGGPYSSGILGLRFMATNLDMNLSDLGGDQGVTFRDGSGDQLLRFTTNNSGSILVYDSTGTLVLTTSAGTLSPSVWAFLEFKAVFGSSGAGSVEVRKGEIVVGSVGSINTGASGLQTIFIRGGTSSAVYIDDINFNDETGDVNNDYDGDTVYGYLAPSANGTLDQWDISGAGTAYECVDTLTPSTNTAYIDTTTVDDVSRFDLAALPGTASTIICVIPTWVANTDIGGLASVAPVFHSGSSDETGTGLALSTSTQSYQQSFGKNPMTSAAWVPSDFTGLEAGVERTA